MIKPQKWRLSGTYFFITTSDFWWRLEPYRETILGWVFAKCSYFLKLCCNYVSRVFHLLCCLCVQLSKIIYNYSYFCYSFSNQSVFFAQLKNINKLWNNNRTVLIFMVSFECFYINIDECHLNVSALILMSVIRMFRHWYWWASFFFTTEISILSSEFALDKRLRIWRKFSDR